MYDLASRHVPRDLLDDVVQEAWLATFGPGRAVIQNPEAYALTVVRYLVSQMQRSRVARHGREVRCAKSERVAPVPTELELVEEQLRVHEAIAALPAIYAEVIGLRHVEGWSAAEISRRTGLPHATVRTRVARAHKLLRELLRPEA